MIENVLPPVSSQVSQSRYCHLMATIRPSAGLKVACAGRELCDPDFRVSRTGFPCFGLEFICRGSGHLILDGHSYPLHAGVVFCYGPGIDHQIVNHSAHRMTKYFVDFCGEEASMLFRLSKLRPGRATQIMEVEWLKELFEQLITEGKKNTALTSRLCAAYLRTIILKAAEGTKPSSPGERSLWSRFQEWRNFIASNYLHLRDLNDVSVRLAVRPAYLCRIFKRFGHSSPFKYLTQLKLAHAADLLAGGCLSVKAITFELGFTDPYHFSRLFKNHFGCSPSRFRERQWRMFGGAGTPPAGTTLRG